MFKIMLIVSALFFIGCEGPTMRALKKEYASRVASEKEYTSRVASEKVFKVYCVYLNSFVCCKHKEYISSGVVDLSSCSYRNGDLFSEKIYNASNYWEETK